MKYALSVIFLTKFPVSHDPLDVTIRILCDAQFVFQTTGKATASPKSYKVCAKSDRATGTLSPSLNAAVTVAEAGGRTVRSVPSPAPWPSRNFALMAEDTRPVEQVLFLKCSLRQCQIK